MAKFFAVLGIPFFLFWSEKLIAESNNQSLIQESEINPTLPFPNNRLRNFYRIQALSFFEQEDRNYSRTLKPFPG